MTDDIQIESMVTITGAEYVRLMAENAKLRAALTPSGETKAAYIGEFSFSIYVGEDDGEEIFQRITVPWTTVKEIMAAILTRAGARRVGR